MSDDDVIVIEPGLGVKLRVVDDAGNYMDWSIVADDKGQVGDIRVITTGGRKNKRLVNPQLAVYPSSNNAVVLHGGKKPHD